MATPEQLVGLTAQHNEIIKRVGNGSLDPAAVKRALQDIIECKTPPVSCSPPTWWRTPEQQLEKAHQLWQGMKLPQPPANFLPQTKTEVLLLHVPSDFDWLWSKVAAPSDYTKYRWDGVKADKRTLRLAPNTPLRLNPVWLAFDPEYGRGKRCDQIWGRRVRPDLGASEVLSALIQFPDWSLAWFNGASAPQLAGYQLKDQGGWTHVPMLDRYDYDRQLRLGAAWADCCEDVFASPSVREC